MGIKNKRYRVGDLVTRANDPQQALHVRWGQPPGQDVWDVEDPAPRAYGVVLAIQLQGSRKEIMTVFWHRWPSPYCASHIRQNVARELKLLSKA